jgi:hypothetical protein
MKEAAEMALSLQQVRAAEYFAPHLPFASAARGSSL